MPGLERQSSFSNSIANNTLFVNKLSRNNMGILGENSNKNSLLGGFASQGASNNINGESLTFSNMNKIGSLSNNNQ